MKASRQLDRAATGTVLIWSADQSKEMQTEHRRSQHLASSAEKGKKGNVVLNSI